MLICKLVLDYDFEVFEVNDRSALSKKFSDTRGGQTAIVLRMYFLFFIFFYSKQFLQHLSTDILEIFPHDALAPIGSLVADFLKVTLK